MSERKDVLSACFGLLTLIAYAKYAQTTESEKQKAEMGEGGKEETEREILQPSNVERGTGYYKVGDGICCCSWY